MSTAVHSRGASLVEVLVSIMFLALFATVVHQFSRSMLRGVRVLEIACEAQEAARIGIDLIVRDLREAGFSPRGSSGNGIRLARADGVEIGRDLNGDGDMDDSSEIVGYHFNAEKGALMRTMGRAPPQPMLDDVAPDGLRFTYVDADGDSIGSGSSLDATERARIRRIDVELAMEIPNPDPSAVTPLRARQRATVALRNCAADTAAE